MSWRLQSDGAYTLLVADFADTSTAWDAYEMLKSVEDGKTVAIEGVVVVKREADGKPRSRRPPTTAPGPG